MNSDTTRIIKKYPNRRLYDTMSSSYITLEGLKKLVLERADFRVIDSQTHADITKSTLLQVISEHEENFAPIFTIEVLQHLIRSYGDNIQSLLGQYLEQAMGFFIQQHEAYKIQQQEYGANPFTWMNNILAFQQQFWHVPTATSQTADEPQDNMSSATNTKKESEKSIKTPNKVPKSNKIKSSSRKPKTKQE